MKKLMVGVLAMILVAGLLAACVPPAAVGVGKAPEIKAPPSITAVTPVVKLHKKSQVVLKGSGFEPGQEIHVILITMQKGLLAKSDIGYALEPKPVPNEMGAWITTWSSGRFIKKEVITEGVNPIMVTDADHNPLAYTSVAFYDAEKPKEEWPSWAKVAVGAK